jgi:uncharacterized membrane protein YqjE
VDLQALGGLLLFAFAFVCVGWMLTRLAHERSAERSRQGANDRVRRRFVSFAYSVLPALAIVTLIVYVANDVQSPYRLALASISIIGLISVGRDVIGWPPSDRA